MMMKVEGKPANEMQLERELMEKIASLAGLINQKKNSEKQSFPGVYYSAPPRLPPHKKFPPPPAPRRSLGFRNRTLQNPRGTKEDTQNLPAPNGLLPPTAPSPSPSLPFTTSQAPPPSSSSTSSSPSVYQHRGRNKIVRKSKGSSTVLGVNQPKCKFSRSLVGSRRVHRLQVAKRPMYTAFSPGRSANRTLRPVKSPQKLAMGEATFIKKGRSLVRTMARAFANEKVRKSIKTMQLKMKKSQQLCMFYTKFGKCKRQEQCKYVHDPTKVAVCRKFLKGECTDVNCLLSHERAAEKMPMCSFFLKGICTTENCPYLHVSVNTNAEVCPDFMKGFCPNGVDCKMKHVSYSKKENGKEKDKAKSKKRKRPTKREREPEDGFLFLDTTSEPGISQLPSELPEDPKKGSAPQTQEETLEQEEDEESESEDSLVLDDFI